MEDIIEQYKGKILPVVIPPPMYYSIFAADKLSMIMLNKNAKNWLYNNFIQLVFYKQNLEKFRYDSHCVAIWPVDTMKMDYTGANMFLREYHINDKILTLTRENLITTIKMWIDKGFYIIGNIDVSKLKGTRYYGKAPFAHSAMIIGYNEQELYQLDFLPKGEFGIVCISFQDYIEAVFSGDLEDIFKNKKYMDIKYNFSLFELKDEFRTECKLDTQVIKFWVKSYIDCSDCGIMTDFFMRRDELACGLAVYDNVNKLVDRFVDNEQNIDFRMFHAIYEHKAIMKDRVKYMLEQGYVNDCTLLEMCDINLKTTEILRKYVLKYNVSKSKGSLIRIKENLSKLKEEEEIFMNVFYNQL